MNKTSSTLSSSDFKNKPQNDQTSDQNKSYYLKPQDLVIVSMGCVLPEAQNTSEYWDLIKNQTVAIKPLSPKRWKKEINYSPYRDEPDKTYSYFGAEISEEIYQKIKIKYLKALENSKFENTQNKKGHSDLINIDSNHINPNYELEKSEPMKIELMTFEALSQASVNLKWSDPHRVGLILGAMNPDEYFFKTRFKAELENLDSELQKSFDQNEIKIVRDSVEKYAARLFQDLKENENYLLTTSVLKNMKKAFNILGRSFLVDAACAAALSSFDVAQSYLKNDILDLVFVGGIESNLGQGTFVLFSKVGALSPEVTLPFDRKSQGLSQGEGAVIFGLQTYEKSLKMNHQVIGVVKGLGASSDGQVASLFQPNIQGQMLAYQRAFSFASHSSSDVQNQNFDLNHEKQNVQYLELHGTGTLIGDQTESLSAEMFYQQMNLPVGSIKSLIGHTKATAGAASLLKQMMIFNHGVIPQKKYISEPIFSNQNERHKLFVNTSDIQIKAHHGLYYRGAVSSFGFGGTNFHLVYDHFVQNLNLNLKLLPQDLKQQHKQNQKQDSSVRLIAHVYKAKSDLDLNWFSQKNSVYKLPPKSLKYIDPMQLLAVQATAELLENKLNIELTQKLKDQTNVISASTLGLDQLETLIQRISLDTIALTIQQDQALNQDEHQEIIQRLVVELKKIKENYATATEESGPGILNNVIAGRVCNAFHLRGKNFNIDCDEASGSAAQEYIALDLNLNQEQLYLLIYVHEKVNLETYRVERSGVEVFLFAHEDFAKKNFLLTSIETGSDFYAKSHQQKSYFGEQFQFEHPVFRYKTKKIKSTLALIFPGQGQILPGDLKNELRQFKPALEYLLKLDQWSLKTLNKKASRYLTEGDKLSIQDQHLFQNLVTFTLQVGFYHSIKSKIKMKTLLLSHSFGEYALLCAAGVLDFETLLNIVYLRDQVSPEKNKHSHLIAVNYNPDKIEQILNQSPDCAGHVYVANRNSHEQCVLACEQDTLKKLISFLKSHKIAALELKNVGRGYHSVFMKKSRESFLEELKKLNLAPKQVQCDFISSVHKKIYNSGYEMNSAELLELLADQLIKPVDFIEISEILKNQNIQYFLEVGFNGLYADFLKSNYQKRESIDETNFLVYQTLNFYVDQNLNQKRTEWSEDVLNSPLLKTIKKYITKVTGYELVDIHVSDHFQEDLRIDSIKKAEIIFKALEEEKLNLDETLSLAQLRSVGDIVEFIENLKKRPLRKKSFTDLTPFALYHSKWQNCQAESTLFKKILKHQTPFVIFKFDDSFVFKNTVVIESQNEISLVQDLVKSYVKSQIQNWLIVYEEKMKLQPTDEIVIVLDLISLHRLQNFVSHNLIASDRLMQIFEELLVEFKTLQNKGLLESQCKWVIFSDENFNPHPVTVFLKSLLKEHQFWAKEFVLTDEFYTLFLNYQESIITELQYFDHQFTLKVQLEKNEAANSNFTDLKNANSVTTDCKIVNTLNFDYKKLQFKWSYLKKMFQSHNSQNLNLSYDAILNFKKNKSKKFKRVLGLGCHRGLGFEIVSYSQHFDKDTELIVVGRTSFQDYKKTDQYKILSQKFLNFKYWSSDLLDLEAQSKLEQDLCELRWFDTQKKRSFHQQETELSLDQNETQNSVLLINSIGLETSQRYELKKSEEIRLEFATKVKISQFLNHLKQKYTAQLVQFSSIVSEFGNDGQTAYAAGSALQNHFGLSLMWPPLDRVGMTTDDGIFTKLKSTGVSFLKKEDAVQLFDTALNLEASQWDQSYLVANLKDQFLFQYNLVDLKKELIPLGPLVSLNPLASEKKFSLKSDLFLLDHVIENNPVVPASVVMTLFYQWGSLLFNSEFLMQKFDIKNILMLFDKNELKFFTKVDFLINSELKLSVHTQMEHISALLQPFGSHTQDANFARIQEMDLKDIKFNSFVDTSTFYSKKSIDFGPRFQVLKEAFYLNQDLSITQGVCEISDQFYIGHRRLDHLIQMIETAFQTSSLQSMLLYKGLTIPLKFNKCRIYQIPQGRIFAYSKLVEANLKKDDKPMISDVFVYNEKNEKVMEILGLEMSVIRHHDEYPFQVGVLENV